MNILEVLNQGMADGLDILNEAVMDDLLGGTIKCKKNYTLQDKGVVNCGCGYSNDGTPTIDPDKNTPKNPILGTGNGTNNGDTTVKG